MKKVYSKPTIEVEIYEINTAIATGCGQVVNLGPGNTLHKTCDSYLEQMDMGGGVYAGDVYYTDQHPDCELDSNHLSPAKMNFYDDGGCSCYLSAQGSTVFTS